MTAAADRPFVQCPTAAGHRLAARLLAGLTAASLVWLSACTADRADVGSSSRPGVASPLGSTSDVPAADAQTIRLAIETINASAADGVAGQQAALAALVEPTQVMALDDCKPPTTTWRFEPIYPGLRPAPGWQGSSGALAGTVYALPTLIRVYTGDRITGTDLTTLHFGVQAGEAFLTPLCAG